MASTRELQTLTVPTGTRAVEVLPALRRALDGDGPALLPLAEDEPTVARRVGEALGAGEPLEPGEDDPADPTALVLATSGSTGTPKGVLLSASALRASATATHRHLGGDGHWLLAMPAHHIAGIQVLIRSLLAGTPPGVVDTTDGFRPDGFAAAARRVPAHGPRYTALVPTQLTRLLDDGGAGLTALREFDAVLLGGSATPPALLRRADESGVRVVTTYGMSETSGGCVYDGVPLEGVRVHLDDEPGAIGLTGPMLARGYRRDPATEAFSAGWFRTGDLGRWHGGRLDVLGRADDVVITGGVNVAPIAVERILTQDPRVREACVLGVPDAEWGQSVAAAVVPADLTTPPAVEELRAAVREQAGTAAAPKHVSFFEELPVRGPGKPDRRALREALAGPENSMREDVSHGHSR
ncbi:O-succinylbenzoic acid--CoA ligase [Saccharopolyspora lacisalsi]|uniref:O-succinylbenzoic acid--CoA ligase n=1 Tax=Halosaccharopolyspora lacisalsi TaxID=1000566 RepID=A0A839E5Y6_9PSEU|nr:o-succinylbenzoate--CoA ligase [Halosaccharopolyspora lacisalsi]MBA8827137.1 O-succinylbenzoic acid--CoA ligase [Halosaccharopolyspora lacisalsi]